VTDLHERSAVEIGRLIASGEVRPRECAEYFLTRAQAIDPLTGAFTTVDGERAVRDADMLEQWPVERRGPLFGVPMAFKDMEAVAGQRTTFGSQAFTDHVPGVNSPIVDRLLQSGVISLGKTSTPELGLVCYTEPDVAPPARTPWNPALSAGGSSGGAAAAVAAGIVPWAQGADGAGSVRTPASACGIVGLKPSRGRVSTGSGGGDALGLSIHGPLARTIEDVAAALDAMCGPAASDTDWAPPAATTFLELSKVVLAGQRIGRYTRPAPGGSVDVECVAAVDHATDLLTQMGHEVIEIDCPFRTRSANRFGWCGRLPRRRWLYRRRSNRCFGRSLVGCASRAARSVVPSSSRRSPSCGARPGPLSK
jgi:amidase